MTSEQYQERLRVSIDTKYYGIEVKNRLDAGDLKIDIASKNWPDDWYSDPHFNISVPMALEIAKRISAVKEFKIFYIRKIDFHHIMFDLDGDTYCIQWYKIFTVSRKSDLKKVYLGRYEIPDWFGNGKHKVSPHWGEGSEMFSPFSPESVSDETA